MKPHISPHPLTATQVGIGDKTQLMRAWRGQPGWKPANHWLCWALGLAAVLIDLAALGLVIYLAGFAHAPLPLFFGQEGPLVTAAGPAGGLSWAAHHVAVWAGFAVFGVAWALANIHLALVLVRPDAEDQASVVPGIILRAVQLGVVFLAAGLFLGGLWSAQTEGRFWRWDSADVWVLIVFLSYLFPLHARTYHQVRDFNFAIGAVLCFAFVVFAWYGASYCLGLDIHPAGTDATSRLWLLWGALLNLSLVFHAGLRYQTHQHTETELEPSTSRDGLVSSVS